jgi:hypothetical protein
VIRPGLALMAGVLGIAGIGAAAQVIPSAHRLVPVATRSEPVGADLQCPRIPTGRASGSAGSPTTALGVTTTSPGTGEVLATGLGGGTRVLVTAGRRAATATVTRPASVTLVVSGRLTPGVHAEELTTAPAAADRATSEVACTAPVARAWFVGAATQAGDDPVLTLSNPGPAAAQASVSVLIPQGVLTSAATQAVAVAPGATVSVPLDRVAPDATATAVEVTTVRGRLAGAVHDDRSLGLADLGGDWIPAQAAPRSALVIGGIPGRVLGVAPHRTLTVANPSGIPVTDTVHLTTDAGSTYVPAGLPSVTVPADSVRSFSLDALLGQSPAAVELTGQPLLGSVLVATSGPRGGDLAYLGPAAPQRGAAAVAPDPVSSTSDVLVVLSAPDAGATVELTFAGPHGPLTRQLVLPAGHSAQVALSLLGAADTSAPLQVRVLGGGGPVYGSRVLAAAVPYSGASVSALTLVGPSPAVIVPAVQPGVRAALP